MNHHGLPHHGTYPADNAPEDHCWCRPVIIQPYAGVRPWVFHRSDPGIVMWDLGEQGPQQEAWMMEPYRVLFRG